MTTNISRQPISSPSPTSGAPMIVNTEISNSSPSSLSIGTSSPSSSASSSLRTTHTNEKKTIDFLLKEMQEEEKKEEEHCDDNRCRGKKNNSDVEHASGTILINIEPTQVCLDEQEKEKKEEEEEEQEKQETEQSSNHLHAENEQTVPADLSKNAQETSMSNIAPDEQRYKTIEIEEIPDEDEDLSICNNSLIEPTDCILTDDELKPSPPTSSTIKSTKNSTFSFDPVLSCYEKKLPKTTDTIDEFTKPPPPSALQTPSSPKRSQRPEDDPIALRALQRFEERMNAAAAAVATKNHTDEASQLTLKGKSSWSGTHSTPRKSIENLFKANQQCSDGEDVSPYRDTFIRPRKTMLDDNGSSFGMTINLFGAGPNDPTSDEHYQDKAKEQQAPTAIAEDENKQSEFITRSFLYPIRDARINYTLELTNRRLYLCLLLSFFFLSISFSFSVSILEC